MQVISHAMRFFFFVVGSVLWLGIGLTGFTTVHWLLYLPAVFFYFAAITGICPGLILSRQAFPETKSAASKKRRKKR